MQPMERTARLQSCTRLSRVIPGFERMANLSPAYLAGNHTTARLVSFGLIGALCTVMYAALYAMFRHICGPLAANVLALIPTMTVNFVANRSITFRAVRGTLTREAALYLVAYLVGLGASSALFALALAILKPHTVSIETAIGVVTGFAATLVRYVLMSRWVFTGRGASPHPLERQAHHP